MITEKELNEYKSLCTTLRNLHDKALAKRRKVKALLEETASRKKEAYIVLAKANRLTRHLTSRQRQMAGITYCLSEIKTLIEGARVLQWNPQEAESSIEVPANISSCLPVSAPANTIAGILSCLPAEFRNLRELKRMGLAIIKIIDFVKKIHLQLDLVEKRCKELILSINKAIEAFRHEFNIIYRKLFPFGIFSVIRRSYRRLRGNTYYSFRDMDGISALGNITGLVLKIANSPII